MALLMAKVNPDTIRLVGRWQSNIILCCLHTTAESFTEGLAIRIFQHVNYALIPPRARQLLVPSSTHRTSGARLTGVSGGLAQNQCRLGEVNISFYPTLVFFSSVSRLPVSTASAVVTNHPYVTPSPPQI